MEKAVLVPTHHLLLQSWVPNLLFFPSLLIYHPVIQSQFSVLQLQETEKTLRILSDWKPRQLMSAVAVEIPLHKAKDAELTKQSTKQQNLLHDP